MLYSRKSSLFNRSSATNRLPGQAIGGNRGRSDKAHEAVGRAMLETLEGRVLMSSDTISVLANLSSATGILPAGGVTMDASGNLYGTGNLGGAHGVGTIFEVAKGSNVATVLASFNSVDGEEPTGKLVLDSAGNLYGTTLHGGPDHDGLVFELAKGSHVPTTLATFNGTNGELPGGLTIDSAGNLYGAAYLGGADAGNDGTVFELAKGSHSITVLASGAAATRPLSDLVRDSAGNLYGISQRGGASANGSVFELAKGSSTFTTLASFNASYQSDFVSGLTADSAGNLYGTAFAGGDANSDGTVFEVVKGSGVIKTLAAFNGTNGSNPASAPLLDSAGNLFGTAQFGGANGDGTAFEVVKGSGAITLLATFNGANGTGPNETLSMDSAGNIYGATVLGGANTDVQPHGDGTVFELSPTKPPLKPAFTTLPASATAGTTISSAIVVDVEDSTGKLVTNDNSKVTLSVASSPAGGAISGTLTVTAVNGIANFSNLKFTVAGTYTLKATDGVLAAAVSAPIVVVGKPGTLDLSFATQGSITTSFSSPHEYDTPIAVLLQHDGKSVVVTSAGPDGGGAGGPDEPGTFDFALTRYTTAGTLDTSYGSHGLVITNFAGMNSTPTSAVMQPNGMVVVAGSDDNGDIVMARYTTSGALDSTFGNHGEVIEHFSSSFTSPVPAIALDASGRIDLAAMTYGTTDFVDAIAAMRFQSNGTLDTTFGHGGVARFTSGPLFTLAMPGTNSASVNSIAIESDGKLMIAGGTVGGDFFAARLTSAGALDTTFGAAGVADISFGQESTASSVQFVAGGKILLGGTTFDAQFNGLFAMARLNTNGTLDTTFGTKGKTTTTFSNMTISAAAMTEQLNGDILLAGSGTTTNDFPSSSSSVLARYTANGILDTTFNSTGKVVYDTVVSDSFAASVGATSVAVQTDGRVVVAGYSGGGHAGGTFDQLVLTRFFGDAPASFSGTVFNDANGDGVLDNGEAGIAGVKVYADLNNNGVYDASDYYVITDAHGNYTFANLAPGTYSVREILPAGSHLTTPTSGVLTLKLAPSQNMTSQNFGNA